MAMGQGGIDNAKLAAEVGAAIAEAVSRAIDARLATRSRLGGALKAAASTARPIYPDKDWDLVSPNGLRASIITQDIVQHPRPARFGDCTADDLARFILEQLAVAMGVEIRVIDTPETRKHPGVRHEGSS